MLILEQSLPLAHTSIFIYILLQQLRQEFWTTLVKTASSTSMSAGPDEPEGKDMGNSFPPRVTWSYNQHRADYVCLFMEEGHMLTMGEDQLAPLISEVCIFPHLQQSCIHSFCPPCTVL